jgi:hypothetical protein
MLALYCDNVSVIQNSIKLIVLKLKANRQRRIKNEKHRDFRVGVDYAIHIFAITIQ